MGRNRSRSRSMSSSSSGRGAVSSTWDGESGYRIHISDLAAGVSRKEVERVFTKFGPINEVWVATNPPCFAFVNYKHRSDAEKAIREIDGKVVGQSRVGVSWARSRTYGGRRGNSGRGPPPYSSSYRSGGGGGGGGRRRSRSRSRSGSRHRRRRYSRSRSSSRDRHRRRSASPRERKRSRHSSNERAGATGGAAGSNGDRVAGDRDRSGAAGGDRRRSRTPRSVSRSRSHSKQRSSPQRQSPGGANGRSRSRGSSIDDRHGADAVGSSSGIGHDGNNSYDRSPVAAAID